MIVIVSAAAGALTLRIVISPPQRGLLRTVSTKTRSTKWLSSPARRRQCMLSPRAQTPRRTSQSSVSRMQPASRGAHEGAACCCNVVVLRVRGSRSEPVLHNLGDDTAGLGAGDEHNQIDGRVDEACGRRSTCLHRQIL